MVKLNNKLVKTSSFISFYNSSILSNREGFPSKGADEQQGLMSGLGNGRMRADLCGEQ